MPQRPRNRLKTIVICVVVLLGGLLLLRIWNGQLNRDETRLLGRWTFPTGISEHSFQILTFGHDRIAVLQDPQKGAVATYDWKIADGKLVLTQYALRDVKKTATYEVYRVVSGALTGKPRNTDLPEYFQLNWKNSNQVELRPPPSMGDYVLKLRRAKAPNGANQKAM